MPCDRVLDENGVVNQPATLDGEGICSNLDVHALPSSQAITRVNSFPLVVLGWKGETSGLIPMIAEAIG